ncbi:MAG: elongation factor P [Mycoplasmatales bacterium]
MATVNDLKNGLTIKYNNSLYQVVEFQHVKPGKGPAFVRTKMRNLDTGALQDITFNNTSEKIEKAIVDKKQMQYLYSEGDTYYMMDMETFDQLEVDKKAIGDNIKWLIENLIVEIVMNEGRIIAINLPEKMEMTVAQCDPGIKGDTKSGGDKNATLETGHVIRVPLFIEQDERIIVNTSTGQYVSRA